jgi:tetratricopeptide (TPR) repeat protein
MARVHIAAQRWPDAEAALRRSLEILPNSKESATALADVYAATERYEEAFEQYRTAADLDPQDPAALLAAATLAIRIRRDVLAAGFLDRLLDARRNLAAALLLYGDVMKARGDRNAARQYYERATRGEGPVDRARLQVELRALGAGPGTPAGTGNGRRPR